jgi:hypothetical protein
MNPIASRIAIAVITASVLMVSSIAKHDDGIWSN